MHAAYVSCMHSFSTFVKYRKSAKELVEKIHAYSYNRDLSKRKHIDNGQCTTSLNVHRPIRTVYQKTIAMAKKTVCRPADSHNFLDSSGICRCVNHDGRMRYFASGSSLMNDDVQVPHLYWWKGVATLPWGARDMPTVVMALWLLAYHVIHFTLSTTRHGLESSTSWSLTIY